MINKRHRPTHLNKPTDEDFVELCRRRKEGCEHARQVMFLQAWTLMNYFARGMDAEEYTFSYYPKIERMLDKFNPKKGNLSQYVKRSFLWHVKRERGKELLQVEGDGEAKQYIRRCVSVDNTRTPVTLAEDPSLTTAPDVDDFAESLAPTVAKSIKRLTKEERTLVIERYANGLTLRAIAAKYGYKHTQAASYRILKAMKKLRKMVYATLPLGETVDKPNADGH